MVRTGAFDAVLKNYAAILQALQISKQSHDDWLKSKWTSVTVRRV